MDDSDRRSEGEDSPRPGRPRDADRSPSTGISGSHEESSGLLDPPLPRYVDWIVAVVIALGGLTLIVGWSVLTAIVDREMLRSGIESGQVTVTAVGRELGEAASLALTTEVMNWVALGLLLTGVAMVLFAIGYAVVRYRVHERTGPADSAWTYRSYGVFGAAASAVLFFVPFSPVAGAALAGYVGSKDGGEQLKIGALSGFLSVLPFLLLLVFVGIGLVGGLTTVGESSVGYVIVLAMGFGALVLAAFGTGAGALGGFIGGRLADDGGL